MKTFKYTIDFAACNLAPNVLAEVKKAGPKLMFENYLNHAVHLKNGQAGTKLAEGRILNRILNKLDLAKDETIELEDSEFDLVKSVFLNEGGGWQPEQIRAVMKYIENVEAVK